MRLYKIYVISEYSNVLYREKAKTQKLRKWTESFLNQKTIQC